MENSISKFSEAFKFEDDEDGDSGYAPEPNIDPNAVNHLKNIVGDGKGAGIDTSSTTTTQAPDAEAELPEYFKPFEEVLKESFLKPEDDKDFSHEAIAKFGPEFAHLKSRDQIYDQTLYRQNYAQAINKYPDYQEYVDVVAGRTDLGDVLKKVIQANMEAQFDYSEEKFAARLEQYFDETGALTPAGKRATEQIKIKSIQTKDQIEAEAKSFATSKAGEYSQYRNVFETKLKTFNPFGIELSDDLRGHIKELIVSGKAQQAPKTPEEKAEREMITAIFSNPKSAAAFLQAADKRAFERGKQVGAKSLFRGSN